MTKAREAFLSKRDAYDRAMREAVAATDSRHGSVYVDVQVNALAAATEAARQAQAAWELLCPACEGVGALDGAHTYRVNPCPSCDGSGLA